MLQTPDEIYDDLIKEFMSQRNAIKEMINDLEQIKSKIDTLFPQQLDKRYMRFFEEKIKSVTELFKVILDMRKEIIKNTKDEFELCIYNQYLYKLKGNHVIDKQKCVLIMENKKKNIELYFIKKIKNSY